MPTKTYIVEILLRAREEIASAVQKAAGSMRELTKAQDDHGKAAERAATQIHGEVTALEQMRAAHVAEKKAIDDNIGSLRAEAKARKDRADAAKKDLDALKNQAALERATATERQQQSVKEVSRLRAEAAAREESLGKVDKEVRAKRRAAATLQTAAADEASANRKRAGELGLQIAQLQAGVRELDKASKDASSNVSNTERRSNSLSRSIKSVTSELGKLAKEAEKTGKETTGLRRFFDDIRDGSSRSEANLAKLGVALHGFQVAFAVKYAQALISVLIGLAGTLVSVAGAAIQAGVALAGSFAAGAAQAIPIVGVLAAVVGRVTAVFKALQLQQQNKLLVDHNTTAQAARVAAATDRVRNAEEALAAAHRATSDATRAVSQARKDAVRELEDLIDAEKRAKLAAEGANLSLEEAQASLRQAIATGQTDQIARAQLGVDEARLGRTESRTTVTRAGQDLSQRQNEGSQGLRAAVLALADARRNEARAARELTLARTESGFAATKETSAVDRLAAMLRLMSPAERALFDALTRLQATYRKNFRPITDIIIEAFTRATARVEKLLGDPKILDGFRRIATAISKGIDALTGQATGGRSRGFFEFISKEAVKNIPIVTDIVERLFRIFQNLARAGSTSLHEILQLFDDYAGKAEKASGHTKTLSDYFKQGVVYLKSWIELGLAAVDLVLALTGAGAKEGVKTIDQATASLHKMADQVRANSDRVAKFFADARTVTKDFLSIIVEVAKAAISIFSTGNVATFADFMKQVVIPALRDTIKVMGILTLIAHAFLSQPVIRDVARWVLTVALLTKGFLILRGALAAVGAMLGFVRVEGAIAFVGNPWVLAISGLVALLIILNEHVHNLGEKLKIAGIALGALLLTMAGPLGLTSALRLVVTGLEGVAAAGLAGRLGLIGTAFGTMLTKVLELIRRLPGLNRLLATTAAESEVVNSTGTGVPGAAKTTSRLGRLARFAGPAAAIGAGLSAAVVVAGGTKAVSDAVTGPKSSDLGLLAEFRKEIEKIAKTGSSDDMRKLADRLRETARVNSDITPGKNLKAMADALDQAAKTGDKGGLAKVADSLGKMKVVGDSGAIKSISDALKAFSGAVDDTHANVTDKTTDMARKFRDSFSDMATAAKLHIGRIRDIVGVNMDLIRAKMGTQSQEAKQAISDNFKAAASAIDLQMHRAGKVTEAGLAEIRRLMIKSLTSWGLSGHQAEAYLHLKNAQGSFERDTSTNAPSAGHRFGGPIPGYGGGDSYHARLEGGEHVWTKEEVKAAGGHGAMFAMRRMLGGGDQGGPRGYRLGGEVVSSGANFYGHPTNVSSSIRDLIGLMEKRWPGLSVTSTTDHSLRSSSGGISLHSSGHAVDLAGSIPYMHTVSEWIKSSGLYKKLTEGIHNPNLAVKYGKFVDGPSYYAAGGVWQQHLSHIHMGIADGVANLAQAIHAFRALHSPTVVGGGAIGNILGGVLSGATRGANRILRSAYEHAFGGTGGDLHSGAGRVPGAAGGTLSSDEALRVFRQAFSLALPVAGFTKIMPGWLGNLLNLATGESSLNPGARNLTPAGVAAGYPEGILQVTRSTFAANSIAGHRNPFSALDSAIASIIYQLKTYGTIRRFSPAGYEVGGPVSGSGPVSATLHGGEHVWTQSEVQRAGGHGVMRAMRKMLGGGAQGGPGYAIGGAVLGSIQSPSREVKSAIEALAGIIDALTSGFGKSKNLTTRIRLAFNKLLEDGGPISRLATEVDAIGTRGATALQKAQFSVVGGVALRSPLSDVEIGQRELGTLGRQRAGLEAEGAGIGAGLTAARAALAVAKRNKNVKAQQQAQADIVKLGQLQDDTTAALAQNAQDMVEKQEAIQQSMLDAVNTGADRANQSITIQQRLAIAFGRTIDPSKILQQQVGVMQSQIQGLVGVVNEAGRTGNVNLRQQAMAQIEELNASIAEATAQQFQNSIDLINTTATRGTAVADRQARLAQIGGTNFSMFGSSLATRGQVLGDQRAGLAGLFAQASAAGNVDKADELNQSIQDLDVTIAENNQAIKDNTNAARAQMISDIQTASGFAGTVGQGATSFFQSLGQLTGQDFTSIIGGVLSGQGGALKTERGGLTGVLSDLLGYTPGEKAGLQGMSPQDLVQYVLSITTGPAFDSIMSRLDTSQQGQFRDLVGAILNNVNSTNANTQAIKDNIEQSKAQSFSSTGWQLFRNAVFNGAGGLLPQYASLIPHAQTGAWVKGEGVAYVHGGEEIVAAGRKSGDFNAAIHVTEQVEQADPDVISNRLFYRWNNRPKS